tara:strand:+ start:763 stop:1062 length:300 start_codon:yes stop_codon:yes gene_type:complete
MCGRFELTTKFDKLPKVLKQDYPPGLNTKYETQSLIRPTDPVLVIKNEGKIRLPLCHGDLYRLGLKILLIRKDQDPLMQDQKQFRRRNYLVEVGNIKDA